MNDFIVWVNSQIRDHCWTNNEFARQAGLASSTVSMVLSGQSNPGFDFCIGVAKAFKILPEDVLRLAGLLPALPGEDSDTAARIAELVKHLPDEEKRLVLEYVEWRYQKSRV